ncbi:hypothetical protein PPYR_02281 [Photinus pyralis]|uniref:PiggyBac transposable element-derived protein domain-containing protein n=1 Tax=Photinus pyralis TaxID=7054 RepID=A0A5N4B6S5_PHOPY|nr:piggyBac transposable element-derived protein 3-like isoform X1 [Photinus pyralis]KAB0805311.1 hypothetical protein PPYR_02281 [Photinus pyralis]
MSDKVRDISSADFRRLTYEQQMAYMKRLHEECDSDENNDNPEIIADDPELSDDEPALRSDLLQVDDSDIEDVYADPDIEVEIDDDDESSDENSDGESDSDDRVLRAKDGTLWKLTSPSAHQTPTQNILRQRSGTSRTTKNLSVSDTFRCIFNQVMCNIVIKETNRKANEVYSKWNISNPEKPQKIWKPLTEEEFDGYLGILITAGVRHSSSEDVKELWRMDAYPLYRATMAINRFWAITRFLRFDNANTRPQRLESDKAAAITELWLLLNNNLRAHYVPSECLTVDEQLFPYRGRTRFTQYMPAKPAKYGIKIWWVCDSLNSYPLTGQIYTGKSPKGREQNQGERVVKDLCYRYKNTGRNIVVDNFFTTLPLARLLLSWGLSIVGTLKKKQAIHSISDVST